MSGSQELIAKLNKEADKEKAEFLRRYFKTAPGEYAAGDTCLGVTVPIQRKIARSFPNLSLKEIETLLESKIHEYRFTALENLVFQYEREGDVKKKEIFNFYLKHTKGINNWDLVDTSAAYIVGNFLFDKDRKILYKLARSKSIWERRIAIIATHYFISKKDVDDTLKISEILLQDDHDLIQKAVGWSLREAWKKEPKQVENFLIKNYKKMPRVTLRYALERFPQEKRVAYMKGLV